MSEEQIPYIEVESVDDLLEKIEDVKEKITDQEYMDLMDKLNNVKKDMDILTKTLNAMANNMHDTIVEMHILKGDGKGMYKKVAEHNIRFHPDQERMRFELYVDGDYDIKIPEYENL